MASSNAFTLENVTGEYDDDDEEFLLSHKSSLHQRLLANHTGGPTAAKDGSELETGAGRKYIVVHPVLPRDIWYIVAIYLPLRDVLTLRAVNHRFCNFSKSPKLWYNMLLRDYSAELNIGNVGMEKAGERPLQAVLAFRTGDVWQLPSEDTCMSDLQNHFTSDDREPEVSHYSIYKRLYLCRTENRSYLEIMHWEKKQLFVCTMCRIAADFHQACCIPLLLILACLLTTFLIGFKTGRYSQESWGVVLIPAQLLTFCLLTGFAQAKIIHGCYRSRTFSSSDVSHSSNGVRPSREIAAELWDGHWASEKLTLCGNYVNNIDASRGGCVRWIWYPIWLVPLALAVVLLSLKVYGALEISWSSVVVPVLLLTVVAPCTVVPALVSSETFDSIRGSVLSCSFLMICSLVMLALRLDNIVEFQAWQVALPMAVLLLTLWFRVTYNLWARCWANFLQRPVRVVVSRAHWCVMYPVHGVYCMSFKYSCSYTSVQHVARFLYGRFLF
eukprot:gb/GECG01001795.1/.p1 GENE.gb/GECG01001795.1/~~gb/GECG01001795.1/.p1  ORF type:complete len:499 (+),score=18.99 gb/GECG01001795.1/:1-1497(+)